MSAGTSSGGSSTAITFPTSSGIGSHRSSNGFALLVPPHSSEGARPPCRGVPQNEISNLTVGKPIAISLAATGTMTHLVTSNGTGLGGVSRDRDRESTSLNSTHGYNSDSVFFF